MPTPSGKFLGRLRDFPDGRDRLYGLERVVSLSDIQPYIDLRPDLPPAFNQGEANSCAANAADGLLSYYYSDPSGFSRLQLYYNARKLENSTANDDGVRLRDMMKVLKDPGAISESLWTYDTGAKITEPPPTFPVSDRVYKVDSYSRLETTTEMLHCLAQGCPFILGFDVYESFDSDQIAQTGVMTYPAKDEQLLGGHAVLAVGYDLAFDYNADFLSSRLSATKVGTRALLLRNSWGTDWGKAGHFWMPLDYIDVGSDCWTATVEHPDA